jgi:hypothetical protein
LSWIRGLRLVELAGDRAVICPRPGQRELLKFLSSDRQQRLAQMISDCAGRRIRLALQAEQDDDSDGPSATGSAGQAGRMTQADRQRVMQLPMVQQVQQLFDVTLIDARPDTPMNSAPEPATDDDENTTD